MATRPRSTASSAAARAAAPAGAEPAPAGQTGPTAPARQTGPTAPARQTGPTARESGPAAPATEAGAADPGAADPGTARPLPIGLRVAALTLVAEVVLLCIAAVFSAVGTADGKSYELASGIALTLIAAGAAAALAAFAVALARARPWTRTPVVMTQLFIGGAGIFLLSGRLDWRIPTVTLAVICLVGVFTPASLRALNRPSPDASAASSAQTADGAQPVAGEADTRSAKTRQATKAPAAKTGQKTAAASRPATTTTTQNPKRPTANRKRKRR